MIIDINNYPQCVEILIYLFIPLETKCELDGNPPTDDISIVVGTITAR